MFIIWNFDCCRNVERNIFSLSHVISWSISCHFRRFGGDRRLHEPAVGPRRRVRWRTAQRKSRRNPHQVWHLYFHLKILEGRKLQPKLIRFTRHCLWKILVRRWAVCIYPLREGDEGKCIAQRRRASGQSRGCPFLQKFFFWETGFFHREWVKIEAVFPNRTIFLLLTCMYKNIR